MPSGYEKSPDYGGPDPWLGGWFSVVVGILALAALAAVTLWAIGAFGATITVTDGDTIRVDGEPVRLVGFNASEIRNAEATASRDNHVRDWRILVGGRIPERRNPVRRSPTFRFRS